jgi:hypothetical protein
LQSSAGLKFFRGIIALNLIAGGIACVSWVVDMKTKISILVCFALAGCGGVTEKGIQLAYEKCESHGGVKLIDNTNAAYNTDYPLVQCKDGLWLKLSELYRTEKQ